MIGIGTALRTLGLGSPSTAGVIVNYVSHQILVRTTIAGVGVGGSRDGQRHGRQISTSSTSFGERCKYNSATRRMAGKHWLPQWRPLRRWKVVKIKLPDFREASENSSSDLTPDQMRSKMKEAGMCPPRPWVERQFEISSTGAVFEPYVPPEGEGKASLISPTGAKQTAIDVQKKSKTMMAIRKIKQFEEGFNRSDFLEQALAIYKKMHETMTKAAGVPDEEVFERDLAQYVTEKAYPEIVHNLKRKTIRWKFLESIEPPRLVHARCDQVLMNENTFGQVTVRFHTKQTLAIYDRFGRLMYGNELTPKDVLEYIVFEKHLADTHGAWRVHSKIIPEWSGTGYDLSPLQTVRKPPPKPIVEEKTPEKEETATAPAPISDSPQVAVA